MPSREAVLAVPGVPGVLPGGHKLLPLAAQCLTVMFEDKMVPSGLFSITDRL